MEFNNAKENFNIFYFTNAHKGPMEVVGSINSATTLLDTDIELELDIIDPPKSVAGELLKLT